ncbi:striatin-related protein [Moniliophthora roreri]|nr:striatin-related protein [Moniliophthora roreri]
MHDVPWLTALIQQAHYSTARVSGVRRVSSPCGLMEWYPGITKAPTLRAGIKGRETAQPKTLAAVAAGIKRHLAPQVLLGARCRFISRTRTPRKDGAGYRRFKLTNVSPHHFVDVLDIHRYIH